MLNHDRSLNEAGSPQPGIALRVPSLHHWLAIPGSRPAWRISSTMSSALLRASYRSYPAFWSFITCCYRTFFCHPPQRPYFRSDQAAEAQRRTGFHHNSGISGLNFGLASPPKRCRHPGRRPIAPSHIRDANVETVMRVLHHDCQRRSKISPPGRSKTSPLNVMRYAVLGGCPGSP